MHRQARPRFIFAKGWTLLIAGLCLSTGLCSRAHAQEQASEAPNAEDALTLQCLVKPTSPPRFVHIGRDTRREPVGIVRLQLRFTAPDQAPEITELANTANDKTHDGAIEYAQSYRLPCLRPEAGALVAVQEFVFDPSDAPAERPLRALAQAGGSTGPCLVMPRREDQIAFSRVDRGQYSKVFVHFSFKGGPDDPPAVTLRHAEDASGPFTDSVLAYVAQYRMPCRKAGQKSRDFDQYFYATPHGGRLARFKVEEMTLADFLPSIQGIEGERLYFDFNGMGCPFDVSWQFLQPALPNGVYIRGKHDANRTEFTTWLAGVHLKLDQRSRHQLLGAQMKIHVQCGVLNLPGAPAAAGE